MSDKNTLPSAAYLWGLSMVAPNEAVMGALLAMAKLWGCTDVGYDAIPRKRKLRADDIRHKNPGRPVGVSVANRKAPAKVMKAFLAGLKDDRFATKDFREAMVKAGWRSTNQIHDAINEAAKEGLIKRHQVGTYLRLGRKIKTLKKEAA
jgi:hypothetical protein